MDRSLTLKSLFVLWSRTSGRHWMRHAWQSCTLVAILALGVASFLSIRMANRAAIQGFTGFTETVTGQSDFTLEAPGDRFLTEWLPEVRKALSGFPVEMAPLLEISARLLSESEEKLTDPDYNKQPGLSLRILGVDLVGIRNLNNQSTSADFLDTTTGRGQRDLFSVIRDPKAVYISPKLSAAMNLASGDPITVLFDDHREQLMIRGLLPANRWGVGVPENLAVMDLPAAMSLMKEDRRITRVELILESKEKVESELQEIEDLLTTASVGRWNVVRPQQTVETGAAMTSAFRLNLSILSLISLLVGLYLVTQSMDAAVIQRRKEIGILRALGVLPAEIRKLWLMDLALFGILGSLLGIFLGWAAAQTVVIAIARTVNALYLATTAQSAQLTGTDWIFGLLLGVVGSLVAGGFPLKIATDTEPAKILASGRQEIATYRSRYLWLGWLVVALGVVCSLAPAVTLSSGRSFPVFGYLTAFCWLLGGAVIVAGSIAPVGRRLHTLSSGNLAGSLGFGKLRVPGNRHRLAVSGLFIAIGMAASMSILIGSFETTITHWMKTRFQADVYLSSRGFSGATSQHFISPATLERIQQEPGVEEVSTYRYLRILYEKKPIYLVGIRSGLIDTREKFLWIEPPRPIEEQPPDTDAWAIINETFHYHYKHNVSDVITLASPQGSHRIWLRGMKADYGNDQGAVLIDQRYLESWYGVDNFSSATLYLNERMHPDSVIASLRNQFPELAIRKQGELLNNALRVFKETFAVTYALKVLGLFVAVIGLALALLNILREDVAGLTTLRALGVTRWERAAITACEGLGMTVVATLGGILLSFALGWLLVFVINRQSFGWTLQYQIPWVDLASQASFLLLLGSVVSWLVGWFAGNQKPLQEE